MSDEAYAWGFLALTIFVAVVIWVNDQTKDSDDPDPMDMQI